MAEVTRKVDPKETGYGKGYQDSVEIETRALFGLKGGADEFYRRQMGLVLDSVPDSLEGGQKLDQFNRVEPERKSELTGARANPKSIGEMAIAAGVPLIDSCNLNLGPGKRVLDIASGQGATSRYFASTGAEVVSRDYSEDLAKEAAEKHEKVFGEVEGVREGVRSQVAKQQVGEVHYGIGDMGNIKASLSETDPKSFDAITVMSRSFMYLLTKKDYQKAVKDYFDLLAPGGKLVLQWRERMKETMPWAEEMHTGTGVDKEDVDGKVVENWATWDASGVKYCWRDGGHHYGEDGLLIDTGSRYLRYPDGRKVELGTITDAEILKMEQLSLIRGMLDQAGFKKIGVKVEELSQNGSQLMFALVAEKPKDEEISEVEASTGTMVKEVLPAVSP
jgi:SAM-dependent methyltransferase